MLILMADDHMRDLRGFLNAKRSEMVVILGDYTWEQMAEDIGLTAPTLRRLKREKKSKGLQYHVFSALIVAFGSELFESLDLPVPSKAPTFDLRLADARRRKKEEGQGD